MIIFNNIILFNNYFIKLKLYSLIL